ncbi:hypothetical protein M0P65_00530 [Candidatus Gracilibacteria bacterium]|nr:hypothetical protein [Candidatus Gracilibacteria bacterium]
MNKKIYIVLSVVLIVILGLILTNKFLNKNSNTPNSFIPKFFNKNIKTSGNELAKMREEIKLNDISLIYNSVYNQSDYMTKNVLDTNFLDFLKNLKTSTSVYLTDNINGGIEFSSYEREISKFNSGSLRNFDIELNISDYKTKKQIENGKVYINGINFGDFKAGSFKKSFKWPIGVELFNVLIRSDNYGDAMISVNSLNSEGDLLLGNVLMKKATIKQVSLGKKQDIQITGVKLSLNDCSLVDKNNACYKGNATLKINHILGNEANTNSVSLNMQAITREGTIQNLVSGGMAFVDFIDSDGNILKIGDGQTVNIVYNITKEDVFNMKSLIGKKFGEKEGYWFYNKKTSLWEERTAKYSLDEKNLTWTATISDIY